MPRKKQAVHASGLVEVKATVGKTIDGKRIQKSFYGHSKLDAQKKADEYKLEQEMAKRTGDVFIKKEHTYNFTYRVNVEDYLVPFFGPMLLTNIRQVDVQKYFNTVQNKNSNESLAKSTLDKHKMILCDIFKQAMNNDLCHKNPVINLTYMSRDIPTERNVFTAKQAHDALEYSMYNHLELGTAIMLSTGVRRSELIGLKWSDIDFESSMIHVQRAIVPTTGQIIEGGTKTASSNRLIPIALDFAEFLGAQPRPCEYIIQGGTYTSYRSPNGYATHFRIFMKRMHDDIGTPILTPHELRHTFATLLRERGVDIYTIQKVMGHTDISITSKIYIHNDVEVLRKAMNL